MRLLTVMVPATLAFAWLHALEVHAQDVNGWTPRNVEVVLAGPPVIIQRKLLGSGQPQAPGYENATLVQNDVYHAPQYMPGYPTAKSIWARVVDVPCRRDADALRCNGYNWSPALGRSEYLYFRPLLVAAAAEPAAMQTPRPINPAPSAVSPEVDRPAPPARPYRN